MLRVGFTRTEITPALGTPLGGYPVEDRIAEPISDPRHAHVLVLEWSGVKVALLRLAWIIIEEAEVAAIRQAVAAQSAIAPDHVTSFAIQTHSAPHTFSAFNWGDKVEDDVQATLPKSGAADQQLQPATVGIGTTQSDVGVKRRHLALATLTGPLLFPYRPLSDVATAPQALLAANSNKDRWSQPMCDYRH